jgi:hypothetical protein
LNKVFSSEKELIIERKKMNIAKIIFICLI